MIPDCANPTDPECPINLGILDSGAITFAFQGHRPDLEQAAYVQDLIRLGNSTVSAGLRWDHYQLLVNQNAVSPRLAVSHSRRSIGASGVFHRIGREVDRGTSTDPEYYSDEPIARYGKTGYRFPEALKRYSNRELAMRTGLSEKTIREARKNRLQPRAKTVARLLWYVRVISRG
jgi:TonB dependent receptor